MIWIRVIFCAVLLIPGIGFCDSQISLSLNFSLAGSFLFVNPLGRPILSQNSNVQDLDSVWDLDSTGDGLAVGNKVPYGKPKPDAWVRVRRFDGTIAVAPAIPPGPHLIDRLDIKVNLDFDTKKPDVKILEKGRIEIGKVSVRSLDLTRGENSVGAKAIKTSPNFVGWYIPDSGLQGHRMVTIRGSVVQSSLGTLFPDFLPPDHPSWLIQGFGFSNIEIKMKCSAQFDDCRVLRLSAEPSQRQWNSLFSLKFVSFTGQASTLSVFEDQACAVNR